MLCARGGYGCNYLLPHLDLELIRANPKIFVGCSDVTTLLTYLGDAAGLVTFHGPMVAGDLSRPGGVQREELAAHAFRQRGAKSYLTLIRSHRLPKAPPKACCMGDACRCCAPRWARRTKFKLRERFFSLRTARERPYRIDRMLMQLKLAGKFEGCGAFVFGEMLDCSDPELWITLCSKSSCESWVTCEFRWRIGLKSGHVSRRRTDFALRGSRALTCTGHGGYGLRLNPCTSGAFAPDHSLEGRCEEAFLAQQYETHHI